MATGSSPAHKVLAKTYRAERGKLIAFLARRFHDVELAEDAVQSATEEASRTWPVRGVPDSPEGVLAELWDLTVHTQMVGYAPLHAAIGDVAERAGLLEEARHAFETAVTHATNQAERAHLRRRAESVPSHGPPERPQRPG